MTDSCSLLTGVPSRAGPTPEPCRRVLALGALEAGRVRAPDHVTAPSGAVPRHPPGARPTHGPGGRVHARHGAVTGHVPAPRPPATSPCAVADVTFSKHRVI